MQPSKQKTNQATTKPKANIERDAQKTAK